MIHLHMGFPLPVTLRIAARLLKKKLSGAERFAIVLQLEPSHACNLCCAGCGRLHEYRHLLGQTLSVEQCLASAAECDAPMVSICGGEPLVYPHIEELVTGLLKQGRVVYLCTNGTLMRRKLTEFALAKYGARNGALDSLLRNNLITQEHLAGCAMPNGKPVIKPSSRFFWNVHLDGLEGTHDAIVGRPGVFKECIAAIRLAKHLGFQVAVNTTIYAQTDMAEIKRLFELLTSLGVDGFTISPGYDFDEAKENLIRSRGLDPAAFFLTRETARWKFANVLDWAKRFNILHTYAYLEFLAGKRELRCTPWAVPTRNVAGWKSPCYLITDAHYGSFHELMQNTDWNAYGVVNGQPRDPRCKNCMAHCGFDPSGALGTDPRPGDLRKNLRHALSRPRRPRPVTTSTV